MLEIRPTLRRFGVRLIVVACCVCATSAKGAFIQNGQTQVGQDSAVADFEMLDVVLRPGDVDTVLSGLDLSPEQWAFAKREYEKYHTSAVNLERSSKARVDAAGAKEFAEISDSAARAGRERPWDRMTELRHQFHGVRIACLRESDAILAGYLRRVAEVLSEEQSESLSDVMPAILRRCYFARLPAKDMCEDLVIVDVFELVSDAQAHGGELDWVNFTDEAIADEDGQIRSALGAYQRELSIPLLAEARYWREPLSADAKSVARADDPWGRREIQDLAHRTRSIYQATRNCCTLIEEILRGTGRVESADLWHARWLGALHPNLSQDRLPDVMHQWSKDEEGLPRDEVLAIGAVYEAYLAELRPLVESAVASAIELRFGGTRAGEESRQERAARGKIAILRLIERSVAAMRLCVTGVHLNAFDAHVKSAKVFHPSTCGPSVPRVMREKFGISQSSEGGYLPPRQTLPTSHESKEVPDAQE